MEKKIKSVMLDFRYETLGYVIPIGTIGEEIKKDRWTFRCGDNYVVYSRSAINFYSHKFIIKYEEPEIETVQLILNGRWCEDDNSWDFYLMESKIPIISATEEDISNRPKLFKVQYKQ